MKKRNTYIVLIIVIVLAVFSGLFAYPNYFNTGVDNLNKNLHIKLPHFPSRSFQLGLDLKGGTHLLYEADLSKIAGADRSSSMQGLRDVIERRINMFGVKEPVVQVQAKGDTYRLVVELAGVNDPAQAIKMIGETPFLEFKEQRPQTETDQILAKQKEVKEKGEANYQEVENWQLAFEDPYFIATKLTGQYLKRADVGSDSTTYKPLIQLQFNDEGAKMFEELTAKNVGKPIAIYIDNVMLSSPTVQEKISGGKAQITGNFTPQEAKELVRSLNAGALPVPIKLVSQETIGPSLGAVSLQKSLQAGLIGFLAIIVFMLVFYRLPGVLASLALGIYVALVLALFKLIPITLTLAGIGGFILSIGMAVDANVLIFARMREELALGKSFTLSVSEGFRRAWPSIRDGNLTTLIVAIILFSFGSSFVKGFAMALSVGILLSMFSAITVTRTFLKTFEGTRAEKWKWLWK